MDQDSFSQRAREALAHLYDLPYLQSHPLARLLSSQSTELSGDELHRLLVDAIDHLRPPGNVPPTSPSLRQYQAIVLRDLEGATPDAVARALGVSTRQARRDHLEGVDSLASVLWDRYRRLEEARFQRRAASESDASERASDLADSTLESEALKISVGGRATVTDLGDTLRDAIEIVGGLIAERRARIESSPSAPLPPVAVDRIIVRQVLLSLLTYAIETSRDGRIGIGTTAGPDQVRLDLRLDPRHARREDETASGAGSDELIGTARRLIEAQGGLLEIDAGEGAVAISLRMPTRPGVPILVIDDNPDVARLVRRYLRGLNYVIHMASAGQKALQLARDVQPKVITLDLLMPTLDGWDVLRQLKSHPETRQIPVVVCSILPDRRLALSAGATEFLSKPITREGLLATLERLADVTPPGEPRGSRSSNE